MGTLQRDTNFTSPSGDLRQRGCIFIEKCFRVEAERDTGKGLHCRIWGVGWGWGWGLTIGHTRGKVFSLVVSASAEVTGALSRRLRRLALQHADDVHAVDALQSSVQALHCSQGAWWRHTGGQGKRRIGRFPGQTAMQFDWTKDAETQRI